MYEGSERDGRQGQGRSSGRGFDLSTLEHLGQLQEVVEQHAKQWADEGEYGTLVTAFDLTCKVRESMHPARASANALDEHPCQSIAHSTNTLAKRPR